MKTYKNLRRNKTGVEVTLIKRHKSPDTETEEVMLVCSSSSSLMLTIYTCYCLFLSFFFCLCMLLLSIKSSLQVPSKEEKVSILNFNLRSTSNALATSQKHPKLHRKDRKTARRSDWGVFEAVQLLHIFITKLIVCLLWTTPTC